MPVHKGVFKGPYDKGGSGNTANIGSIKSIPDILSGNGTFKDLGEDWFDDYWMNYGKLILSENKPDGTKATKKLSKLEELKNYRNNPQ